MKGPIFLRFLPLRHSLSQHFTVLQMRDAVKRTAAVVEQMGGVTADLPSLKVRNFGTCFCEILYSSLPNFVILANNRQFCNSIYYRPVLFTGRVIKTWGWRPPYAWYPPNTYFLLITINGFGIVYLCSEDASCFYFSTANICLDTRSISHSLPFTHFARCKPKYIFWPLIIEQLNTTIFLQHCIMSFPLFLLHFANGRGIN